MLKTNHNQKSAENTGNFIEHLTVNMNWGKKWMYAESIKECKKFQKILIYIFSYFNFQCYSIFFPTFSNVYYCRLFSSWKIVYSLIVNGELLSFSAFVVCKLSCKSFMDLYRQEWFYPTQLHINGRLDALMLQFDGQYINIEWDVF